MVNARQMRAQILEVFEQEGNPTDGIKYTLCVPFRDGGLPAYEALFRDMEAALGLEARSFHGEEEKFIVQIDGKDIILKLEVKMFETRENGQEIKFTWKDGSDHAFGIASLIRQLLPKT